jgi:hypothetical protein
MASSDDEVLTQAAGRAPEVLPPAIAKVVAYSLDRVRGFMHTDWPLAPEVVAEVLAMPNRAPAPAVDGHPTLATLLCDITGLSPETWPAVCDVTVIELADRLLAAGYVRTGPVPDREALVRIIADTIPVDPDDGTTPVYWEQGQAEFGEYWAPTWGAPETVADMIVDAILPLLGAGVVRGTDSAGGER